MSIGRMSNALRTFLCQSFESVLYVPLSRVRVQCLCVGSILVAFTELRSSVVRSDALRLYTASRRRPVGATDPASSSCAAHEGTAQEVHSPAEAIAEDKQLMAIYEARRAERKQFGPSWRCGDCSLSLPSAGFDVDMRETTELHKTCIGTGHWRCCSACTQVRGNVEDVAS